MTISNIPHFKNWIFKQSLLAIFPSFFLFTCQTREADQKSDKNLVVCDGGELSISSGAIEWFEKNNAQTGDLLGNKISDLFIGISNCIPDDSFAISTFMIDSIINDPFLSFQKVNLDEDPDAEVVLIIGDRTTSQLLFLVLDFNKNAYRVRFLKGVYCRYELPVISFLNMKFGNSLVEIVEKGGGSGISDTYRSYYRFVSNKVMGVLTLKSTVNMNGTLKMENSLDTILTDDLGELNINYHCKYWLCASFDERIVAYDKPGEWEAGKKNCLLPDGILLIDKTYLMHYTWHKDNSVFIPDFSKSSLTSGQLDLLNNFSVEETYAKKFFVMFQNDLNVDNNSPTFKWIYRRFALNKLR